jgi:aspartyl-tRNA(Asn)/glutamyl-tRNA(Gln) amidotransferase subunit A
LLFSFTNIKNYHRQLASGATTCEQAVQFYLTRITEHQQLNALVHVFAEEALERARLLDEQRLQGVDMGSLHGVVLTVKDVILYKGHPVTAASRMLKGYEAAFHATAVERLLNAGAILIGSANCDEFAMGSSNENSTYGTVRNAKDTNRVAGGSSGGSAVAVQAGLCMASLGSDTGGSVRQPADFCGIVGVKPTYGRVSRHGLIAYGSSFDQIGVLSRSVEDAALILSVMAGPDKFDATVSSKPVPDYAAELLAPASTKPVIGYFRPTIQHEALDPEIRSSILSFLDQVKQEGYTLKELDFDLLEYIVPAYYVLTTAEASSNLSRYDGVRYGFQQQPPETDLTAFYAANRTAGFGKEVQRRIMLGTFVLSAGYYDAYYTKAQQVRRVLLDQTEQIFKEVDLLLMPVSPSTAFRIGEKSGDPLEMYLADIFTVFANLVGVPAVSIPLFEHSNGMPFGIQLLAGHFEEVSLLRTSSNWMQTYRPEEA